MAQDNLRLSSDSELGEYFLKGGRFELVLPANSGLKVFNSDSFDVDVIDRGERTLPTILVRPKEKE
jgi:hypothetical protein